MVAWCYLWAVCDPEIGGLGLKTLGDAGERGGFERLQGIFSKCELCLKCETRHGVVTGAVGGWNDGITVTGLSRHGVARLGATCSASSIHLNTHILPIDPFAGPMILDVEVRLEAQPIVVDPEQLPGRA